MHPERPKARAGIVAGQGVADEPASGGPGRVRGRQAVISASSCGSPSSDGSGRPGCGVELGLGLRAPLLRRLPLPSSGPTAEARRNVAATGSPWRRVHGAWLAGWLDGPNPRIGAILATRPPLFLPAPGGLHGNGHGRADGEDERGRASWVRSTAHAGLSPCSPGVRWRSAARGALARRPARLPRSPAGWRSPTPSLMGAGIAMGRLSGSASRPLVDRGRAVGLRATAGGMIALPVWFSIRGLAPARESAVSSGRPVWPGSGDAPWRA